ncbi:MAG: hypothetical protein CMN77_02790 [Spirochaetaceae bacterium]|nr:hypothetical protein [Spirochaetaceae bacterium]|tara:strand:- start:39751 stop:41130 length:1380 start_codon:yes stop_codon:yes gene_type:complete
MSSKNLHLPPRFQKSSLFFKILSIIILILGMGHFYDFQKGHRRYAQSSEQLDFPAYYLAHKMTLDRQNVYSLPVIQQAAKDHDIEFKIFRANLYSPPFYLFMIPLPEVSMQRAQSLFVSIKAFLMTAIVVGMAMYLLGMDRYRKLPNRRYWILLLTGVGLAVLPVLNPLESDFKDGQINVLTLATLVVALVTERKYPVASGIALSMGAVIKLSPLYLGLKLIVEKRWKLIGSVFATLLILGLASIAYFSWEAIWFYIREVLFGFLLTDRIPILEWPVSHPLNQSFKSLYSRLFISNFAVDPAGTEVLYYNPALGKALTFLTNAGWVISCIALTRYVRNMPENRWKSSLHFSYYVAVMTMISPLTWYHHQVVLILPLLVLLFYGILHVRDSFLILAGVLLAIWLFYFPPFYIYTDLLKQWNDFLYRGFSAFYYVKLLANIILALLLFLVIKKEKQRNLEA